MQRRTFIKALVAAGMISSLSSRSKPSTELKKVVAKTGSMLPTIHIDSVLTVDTSYYNTKAVERFDIVALIRRDSRYPGGPPIATQLVARVIGLSGEKVLIKKNIVHCS